MSEEEKKLLEDVEATVKHIREVKEIIATQNPDKKTVKGIKTPEGNSFTVSNENKETTTGVKETGKGFKITVRQKNVTTSLGRSKADREAAEKYFEDLKKLRENPELTPEQVDEIDQILVPLQASFDRVNRAKQKTEEQISNEEEQAPQEVENNNEEQVQEIIQPEEEKTPDKSEPSEEIDKMEKLKEIVEMEKEYQALVGKTSQYNGKSREEIPIGVLLQAEKLNEKILTATEEAGLNIDDVIKAYDDEMARIEAEKKKAEKKEPTIEEQLAYIEQQLAVEEENLMSADEFEAPGISEAILDLQRNKKELEEKQKAQEEIRKAEEQEAKRKVAEEERKNAEAARAEELKQKITEMKVRIKASQILVQNIESPKNTEKSNQQAQTWIMCKEFLAGAGESISKYYEELTQLSGHQAVEELKNIEPDIDVVRDEIINIRQTAQKNAEQMQEIADKYEKERIEENIKRAQAGIGKKAEEINAQINGKKSDNPSQIKEETEQDKKEKEEEQQQQQPNPYGRRARREILTNIQRIENQIQTLQHPVDGMSNDERSATLAKLQAALEFEQGRLAEIQAHWEKVDQELNPQRKNIETNPLEPKKAQEQQEQLVVEGQPTKVERTVLGEQETEPTKQQVPVVVKEKGIMTKLYENVSNLLTKASDAIKIRRMNKAISKAVNQYMQLTVAEKYAYVATGSLDQFLANMSADDKKIAQELGDSLIEEDEGVLESSLRRDFLRREKKCTENPKEVKLKSANRKINEKAIGTFEKSFQKAIELYGSLSPQGKAVYMARKQYDAILNGVEKDISVTELQKMIHTFTRMKNTERIRQPEAKRDVFEHVEIDNSSPEQVQEQTQARQPRTKGNNRGRMQDRAQRMVDRRAPQVNDDGAIDAEFVPIPEDTDLFMEDQEGFEPGD